MKDGRQWIGRLDSGNEPDQFGFFFGDKIGSEEGFEGVPDIQG